MRRALSTLLFLPMAYAVANTPVAPETVWIPLAGAAPGAEPVQLEASWRPAGAVLRVPASGNRVQAVISISLARIGQCDDNRD